MGAGGVRELTVPLACSQENHKLRDQNDDLNGQILSLSLYEAKNLFATQTKAQSLAAEIDTASRDEVPWPFALALALGPGPPVTPAPPRPAPMSSPRLPGQEKQARAWTLRVPVCNYPA